MSDYDALAVKVGALQSRLATFQAPISTVVPVVSGTGRVNEVLTCSRGSWDHAPTTYAFQWKSAAVNVGTNVPTYTPVSGDVTKLVTCVVTATNATGGTAASPSNGITVVT